MSAKRVLSVGQCGADHGSIRRTFQRAFGAEVDAAGAAAEALDALRGGAYTLVLVNRVFDHDGSSGVDFVRRVKAEAGAVPVMLVSNYDDAQEQAVEAGALPGFGKASLGDAEMLERVRAVLGGSDAS
jgi:two-component system, chemotaxis family, chemotaxis protein CheY